MTKVEFILSSISRGWLFSYVNHTSIYGNSELNVFKKIECVGKISNNWQNGLLGTNVYKTLKSCRQFLLTMLKWTNTTSVISRLWLYSIIISTKYFVYDMIYFLHLLMILFLLFIVYYFCCMLF